MRREKTTKDKTQAVALNTAMSDKTQQNISTANMLRCQFSYYLGQKENDAGDA